MKLINSKRHVKVRDKYAETVELWNITILNIHVFQSEIRQTRINLNKQFDNLKSSSYDSLIRLDKLPDVRKQMQQQLETLKHLLQPESDPDKLLKNIERWTYRWNNLHLIFPNKK